MKNSSDLYHTTLHSTNRLLVIILERCLQPRLSYYFHRKYILMHTKNMSSHSCVPCSLLHQLSGVGMVGKKLLMYSFSFPYVSSNSVLFLLKFLAFHINCVDVLNIFVFLLQQSFLMC